MTLYGCGTWSLKLRDEYRLKVFDNRVLRKIFGSKRNEVRGEWRKLQKEVLHNLYCAPNIDVFLWYRGLTGAMTSPF